MNIIEKNRIAMYFGHQSTPSFPPFQMIVHVSKSVAIMTTGSIMKVLKGKEASHVLENKPWPHLFNTDSPPNKKPTLNYRPPTAEILAYLDFSVSTTGRNVILVIKS